MPRTLRQLAALAMVALITAGCSNAPAAPTGTGTGSGSGNYTAANRQQAVKFAECMRANGVKGFPDPDASGQLTIDGIANGSSVDTNSAAFKQAISACKDLEPAGFTGQKRSAQEQEAALKFAQCIRDHGVKDFPDPAPDAAAHRYESNPIHREERWYERSEGRGAEVPRPRRECRRHRA